MPRNPWDRNWNVHNPREEKNQESKVERVIKNSAKVILGIWMLISVPLYREDFISGWLVLIAIIGFVLAAFVEDYLELLNKK